MWLNVHKKWALGGLGFIFGVSFRVGYRYWARGSGPWAVRVAKNSARAIFTTLHCKKFWVIALPNFGQMYALPKKNGQKPNFFGYDKQKPKVDFGFCITQSTSPK